MPKDDNAAGGGSEAVTDTGVDGSPSVAAALDRSPSKRSVGYQTAGGGVVLGMPAEIACNDDAAVLDAHKLKTTGQEQHTHIPGNQLGGGSLERLSILEVQERYETEVPYCRCGGPYFCERHLRMPWDPSADDRDFDDAFPANHPGIWEHHPEISASRKAAILSVNRFYVHFVNTRGNSDAGRPDTNPTGWIQTQGELVLGFMLIIKAILPDHRIKFPGAAEALTSDETPITGRDLETDLTDAERDDYFKVLKLTRCIVLGHLSPVEQTQLLMFAEHEQRILRDINCRRHGLSKDPEQNQRNTEKNGGFAWKAFFLHKSMSTYDCELAVPCPVPPEEARTGLSTWVEKFRAIWVPTGASASRTRAFLIVTFSSSDLDAMSPDERATYIEVLHSSDVRAQDPGNVLIVEGANLLKPGCRYFIDIEAERFDWSETMSELKAEQVDGAHEGTEAQIADESVMHMSKESRRKLIAAVLNKMEEISEEVRSSAVPQSETTSCATKFPLQTEEAGPVPRHEEQAEADANTEIAPMEESAVSDRDGPEKVSSKVKRPHQEDLSTHAKRSKY
ncbi:hypothetical protein CB0940_01858 [Cercospora beticola]|uniref:Uncharacterized protein n=1 Tax=Cercospora beticola TaxID=122368 RepID=A0A2G5IDC7_CERBT|nr:hypothetical protein CB0940_01858 [Cercospora beticola]PIB02483.1 hypothetical protein CB0940_01858 [Cercospora beticola]WPA97313.1 hypothetical protein RHO25_001922 [Cercospora beticola]